MLVFFHDARVGAQLACNESQRCFYTIGSPGRYASIGLPHRMLFAEDNPFVIKQILPR
jgi:hypothetical protein